MTDAFDHGQVYVPGDRVTLGGSEYVAMNGTRGNIPPDWPWVAVPTDTAASGQVVTLRRNGLFVDLDLGDLSGVSAVLVDPSAQPWESGATYSINNLYFESVGSSVPSTILNDDVRFSLYQPAVMTSDAEEPDYPEVPPGGTSDPFFMGNARADLVSFVEWEAELAVAGSGIKTVANGWLWSTSDEGDTGAAPPNWASAPDQGDTVVDGDISWLNEGRAVFDWEPSTEYPIEVSADGSVYLAPVILPTVYVGGFIDLSDFVARTVVAGDDEPDWASVPSGGFVSDGGAIWMEDSSTVDRLVITTLVAPSGAAAVTVANIASDDNENHVELIAQNHVTSEFGPDAMGDPANRFASGTDTDLVSTQTLVTYAADATRWRAVPPAT